MALSWIDSDNTGGMEAVSKVNFSAALFQRLSMHVKSWATTSYYMYTSCVFFVLLCTPTASLAKNCALYDPPVPGLTCFHGDQVIHAITNSPTSWMVEFYSSWCGHCQHFAPVIKELGGDIKQWSSVIRIGVLDCTGPQGNQDICTKVGVGAYPTIRVYSTKFNN